jgi:hypothetical protein
MSFDCAKYAKRKQIRKSESNRYQKSGRIKS